MDETAIAFELPQRGPRATQRPAARPHLGPRLHPHGRDRRLPLRAWRHAARPLQRRSRGLAPRGRAQDDDVDQVLSYDTITEAIEPRWPPSGSTCSRPWPNGSPPAACRPARGAGVRAGRETRPDSRRARRRDRPHPAAAAAPRLRPAGARAGAARHRARRRLPGPPWPSVPTRRAGRRAGGLGGPLVLCLAPATPPPAADRGAACASASLPSSRRPGRSPTRSALRRRRQPNRARLGDEGRPAVGLGAGAHADRRAAAARRPTPATRPGSRPGLRASSAPTCRVAGAAPSPPGRRCSSVAAEPADLTALDRSAP